MTTVELEIPSKTFYVGVARLAVSTIARSSGIEEERVEDLKIAVSEACANAVLSNEQTGSTEPVGIAVAVTDDLFEIEIADRGPSYEAGLGEGSETWPRMSMSRALMASLVDDFRFEAREGGGLRCVLAVRRSPPPS